MDNVEIYVKLKLCLSYIESYMQCNRDGTFHNAAYYVGKVQSKVEQIVIGIEDQNEKDKKNDTNLCQD